VKFIPAQYVTPFVRGNHIDHHDAVAIAKASQRSYIRFVPIKTEHQQAVNCLYRLCRYLTPFISFYFNQ
jgi:transposase